MTRSFYGGIFISLIAVAICPASIGTAKDLPDPEKIIAADPDAGRLLEVPFIPQKDYECGPASLAMVLGYYKIPADADRIAKRFETEKVAGTFTVDLLIAATERGVEAHWVAGTMEALRAEIDRKRPAIVFLNLAINPLPRRHFAVAAGYVTHRGKNYIVLHSGRTPWLLVPEKKFMREWKRTGYLMMTIDPKEKSGSRQSP